MHKTIISAQKDEFINDLQDMLDDKIPYITNDYIERIKKLCNDFIKLYIEPQLQGQDTITPVQYIIDHDPYRTSMGEYNSSNKTLHIYLDEIALRTSLKKFFDENGKVIDGLTQDELDDLEYDIKLFYIVRNKKIIQLLNTIAHEYRHSFQDRYMAYSNVPVDKEVYEVFGEDSKQQQIHAEQLEEAWRCGGFVKNKEKVYELIINPDGKTPALKMKEAFEHTEEMQMIYFVDVYGILNNLDTDQIEDLIHQIRNFSYNLEIHERDARKGSFQTLLSLKKDLIEYAKTHDDGTKRDTALEIFEKLDFFRKNETHYIIDAKKQYEEFVKRMKECTIEDFVNYAEILKKRECENYFSAFEETVIIIKKSPYLKHIFSPESRKKICEMLKAKGLDDYAKIIWPEENNIENDDDIEIE